MAQMFRLNHRQRTAGHPRRAGTNLFSCAFLLLGALSVCGCGKSGAPKPPSSPPAPVEVVEAVSRTMPVELKAIGTAEPLSTVRIRSKVQGEILEVLFADGQPVRAGDPLFRIDPRLFEAALKRAEANLAIAKSASDNASEQAARYTTLIKRGVASKEQTSQVLTVEESGKSELAARQADLDEARLMLEWTTVAAPISGRAGAALLKAGNMIQPNVDTLAVINQIQPIYVTFSLPENTLDEVRRAMQTSSPPVRAYGPDSGELLGEGTLTFIDNAVDRGSGMILYRATFPNAGERLWPGQFVDVKLTLGEESGVVVPSAAIVEGPRGAQVFVVRDGVAELRPVEAARSLDGQTIVRSGLAAGERVITNGHLRVSPGGRVAEKAGAAKP